MIDQNKIDVVFAKFEKKARKERMFLGDGISMIMKEVTREIVRQINKKEKK